MIIEATQKLISKEELSFVELNEVFDEIYSGLANNIQASSFITALNTLDMSIEATSASIKSAFESFKKTDFNIGPTLSIENILFQNNEQYIDISFLQDLVCSACGLNIVKHQFDDFSNISKFKTLESFGINLNKNIDYNSADFEKLNFAYIYLKNDVPYYKYSSTLERNLPFDKIIKTTSLLFNPFNSNNLFLGVKDKNDVQFYANLALELKKENSVIVASDSKLPFVSPEGENFVAEAWKNKIFTYVLSFDLLGFKQNSIKSLEVESNEQQVEDVVNILSGKIKDSKYDTAIVNSALSLYISKKADSIIDGIDLAKKTIDSGLALEKLEQIKKFYL